MHSWFYDSYPLEALTSSNSSPSSCNLTERFNWLTDSYRRVLAELAEAIPGIEIQGYFVDFKGSREPPSQAIA